MGPGHLGIGLAAKPVAPKAPLWALFVASEALDLLSAVFITTGVERMAVTQMDFGQGLSIISPGWVPWSHGLVMSIIWSLLFAAIAYLAFEDWKTSGVIGLVTFSHWILDFIVHPPDLPILFRDLLELGLGLWTSGPGLIFSLILELAILAGGIVIYLINRKRAPNADKEKS